MPGILVNPDHLLALSNQLQQVATELFALDGRLAQALGRLDWTARVQAGVEDQATQARTRARSLAETAAQFATYVRAKAHAFAEADAQGVQDIGQLVGTYTSTSTDPAPAHPGWTYPAARVAAYQELTGGGGATGDLSELPDAQLGPPLLDLTLDQVLERFKPWNMAQDIWDSFQSGPYNDKVTALRDAWSAARAQYGSDSPEAQTAGKQFWEYKLFEAPFFGSTIEALMWMLQTTAKPAR